MSTPFFSFCFIFVVVVIMAVAVAIDLPLRIIAHYGSLSIFMSE